MNTVSDPDSITESKEAPETGEITAAEDTNDLEDNKPNPVASILLTAWTAIMSISTVILSFYLFVLKDDSVFPFVILGLIGLCIPHIVNFIRSTVRHNEIKRKHEARIQKAMEERILQARLKEAERMRQENIMSAKYELDEKAQIEAEEMLKNAYRNIDTTSFKPG
jgi:hypothetical protein